MSRWRYFTDVELQTIRDLMPTTIMAIEVSGEQSRRIRDAETYTPGLSLKDRVNAAHAAFAQTVPGRVSMTFTTLKTEKV